MVDSTGEAVTELGSQRRREAQATPISPPRARGLDSSAGGATAEPAREERVRRALDRTEEAARLLEEAFVLMVGENGLSMSAAERLYSALREAEASVIVLEVQSAPRRALGRATIRRAIGRGELAANTDVGLAIDLLVGPPLTRGVLTGEHLDEDYA